MKNCLTAALAVMFLTNACLAIDISLKKGDKAPEFTVKDDTGADWKSSDHFGKKIVVVYFYPADMTGGCTAQACAFRDDLGKLKEMGIEVVGVSGDTVENHQAFKKVYELNFALLADPEGKVANAFGVPFTKGEKTVTKEFDGKEYVLTRGGTAKRWTFIIGKDGKVAYKNEEVNAAQDSKKIAEVVADLNS